MWKKILLAAAVSLALAPAGRAQSRIMDTDAFVAANLIAIFYHEFGHALVDVMRLPIFGQEEDAADVLSILMVHEVFEENAARDIAWASAVGMKGAASAARLDPDDVAWWDVHGPDLQRYYTMVCLFYGADSSGRRSFARDMDLPDARARYCEEEYELASESWGPVLDELYDRGAGESLRFRVVGPLGRDALLTVQTVREEVMALNAVLSLPEPVDVLVEACGEANAFYDPNTREIIMCTEFAEYLRDIAP